MPEVFLLYACLDFSLFTCIYTGCPLNEVGARVGSKEEGAWEKSRRTKKYKLITVAF